jgi:hypothetical protein
MFEDITGDLSAYLSETEIPNGKFPTANSHGGNNGKKQRGKQRFLSGRRQHPNPDRLRWHLQHLALVCAVVLGGRASCAADTRE